MDRILKIECNRGNGWEECFSGPSEASNTDIKEFLSRLALRHPYRALLDDSVVAEVKDLPDEPKHQNIAKLYESFKQSWDYFERISHQKDTGKCVGQYSSDPFVVFRAELEIGTSISRVMKMAIEQLGVIPTITSVREYTGLKDKIQFRMMLDEFDYGKMVDASRTFIVDASPSAL